MGHLGRAPHLRRGGQPGSSTGLAGHRPTTTATCCAALRPGTGPGRGDSTARASSSWIGRPHRWACTSGERFGTTSKARTSGPIWMPLPPGSTPTAEARRPPGRGAAAAVLPVTGTDVCRTSRASSPCSSPRPEHYWGADRRDDPGLERLGNRSRRYRRRARAAPCQPAPGMEQASTSSSKPSFMRRGSTTLTARPARVPCPAIAFNDNLGWTHTSNTIDTGDLFLLTSTEMATCTTARSARSSHRPRRSWFSRRMGLTAKSR